MSDRTAEIDAPRRRRINWTWIGFRLSTCRCPHDWAVGSRKTGAKACRKCGVWCWWPLIGDPRG